MVSVFEYKDSKELAHSVGQFILDKQNEALKDNAHFSISISGGSLIKVLRQALVEDSSIAQHVQWQKWNIFFSDERLVPLDHEDSNYGAFKTLILDELTHRGILGPVINTINEALVGIGATENEKIAHEYESLLPKSQPLDLILLGCGPDGHTCSLFPGPDHEYLLKEDSKLVAWCHDSPKPPSDRITLTLPALRSARNIAFVAEGASKQQIMGEIFINQNLSLPCVIVNQQCSTQTNWFVNTPALEGLQLPFSTTKY